VSVLAHQALPARAARDLPRAEELDRALRDASPAEVIAAALAAVGRERLAVVSSFGTESAALLKVMADVDPAIPVVFLDTGWLFEETLAYRDTLIATLGLRDVRSVKPLEEALSREDGNRDLWFSDPDACCRIRKVEPLARALAPFSAWINGRKRFQGGLRADMPVVEEDGVRLKFNPFANVSREEIEAIYALAKLPPHPLVASGFLSVGCMPCTSRTAPDEDARAGRWRDRAKTECGIHTVKTSQD
jgi:phosphoadenosine phosphosulfate reductase